MSSATFSAAPTGNGGWTLHKNAEGREYYYNKALNKTTWDKPDELKTESELAASTAWKEFTTSAGKKYYYNSETKQTTWTVPDCLKGATEAAAAAEEKSAKQAAAEEAAKEAAQAADEKRQFLQMLDSSGVKASMEWDEAMRLIISKPQYRILKTLAERKAAFGEWRDSKREALDEERRREARQLKIDFITMLKGTEELTSRTRYSKAAEIFASDRRWAALDHDELEREELYEEYALSLERKEAVERRSKRKERMEAFRELLSVSEITVRAQWRRVQERLANEPAFRALDKIDRLAVYEEYMRERELEEEQSKMREREGVRRRERVQRDAFRSLLLSMQREGTIGPRTRWRDVVDVLMPTAEYRAAAEQTGSTPSELFEDVVEASKEEYASVRKRIKACLAARAEFEISEATSAEALEAEVGAAISAADGADSAMVDETGRAPPQWAVRTYLVEAKERLEGKAADERRRAERGRRACVEAYAVALSSTLGGSLSRETTWEQAEAALGSLPARPPAIAALSEAEQKAAFTEFIVGAPPPGASGIVGVLPPPPPPSSATASTAAAGGDADGASPDDGGGRHGGKKEKRHKSHKSERRHRSDGDSDEEGDERRGHKKKKRRHHSDKEREGGSKGGADAEETSPKPPAE